MPIKEHSKCYHDKCDWIPEFAVNGCWEVIFSIENKCSCKEINTNILNVAWNWLTISMCSVGKSVNCGLDKNLINFLSTLIHWLFLHVPCLKNTVNCTNATSKTLSKTNWKFIRKINKFVANLNLLKFYRSFWSSKRARNRAMHWASPSLFGTNASISVRAAFPLM